MNERLDRVGASTEESAGASVSKLGRVTVGSRKITTTTVSTLAVIAAGTGGLLAVQTGAAHASEPRTSGVVAADATTGPSTDPSSDPSSMPSSDPSTSPSSDPSTGPTGPIVQRISGDSRYETGVKISQELWSDAADNSPDALHADAVVLATGASFPDALAGGPLASAVKGPLLLTTPDTLPDVTKAELVRVLASGKTVYILGGTGAVSMNVQNQITALGYGVHRLGGADRFSTSVVIAQQVQSAFGIPADEQSAVVATGTNFPDALSAGPLASLALAPIVLTNGTQLTPATATYLESLQGGVLPVGGPAYTAVNATPEPGGDPCNNLAGSTRYETSAAVADCVAEGRAFYGLSPSAVVGVATGMNFPDALTGGAFMGALDDPLLLTDPNSLSGPAANELQINKLNLQVALIFGGTGAVSPTVENQIVSILGAVVADPASLNTSQARHHLIASLVRQAGAHASHPAGIKALVKP
jgi:putative cell wall-binding protein